MRQFPYIFPILSVAREPYAVTALIRRMQPGGVPLTSDPSLRERTALYRAKAEDALERAAAAADPSIRNGLLHLAAGWHGLARELETKSAGPGAMETASRPAPEQSARR
jgi:hypothetical protein